MAFINFISDLNLSNSARFVNAIVVCNLVNGPKIATK